MEAVKVIGGFIAILALLNLFAFIFSLIWMIPFAPAILMIAMLAGMVKLLFVLGRDICQKN
jgi:hypothetical protein